MNEDESDGNNRTDDEGDHSSEKPSTTLGQVANYIKSGKHFDIVASGWCFSHGVPVPPSIIARIRQGLEHVIDATFDASVRYVKRRTEQADFDDRLQREVVRKVARQGVNDISPDMAATVAMSYLIEHQRKYTNKSAVVSEALTILANDPPLEDHAPEARIGEDWLNYFADIAAQKSSHDMRVLMGRILAGEIRRPGSFSPLTIQVLATLTQDVAKKFERLCEPAFDMEGQIIIPQQVATDLARRGIAELGITYLDLLALRTYGLLVPDALADFEFLPNSPVSIKYGGKNFIAKIDATATAPVVLKGMLFSHVGRELHNIIQPMGLPRFENWFRSAFEQQGIHIEELR